MRASEKKLINKLKNEILNEEIDKMPIPEDVINYQKNVILNNDHYGWFVKPNDKKEKKVDIYCAACQNTFNDYKPTHNTYVYCAHCGNDILVRRAFASQSYKVNKKENICYMQKINDVIIARFFDTGRYYRDHKYEIPLIDNIIEFQRIIFRKESTKNFIKYISWYPNSKSNWSEMSKVREHNSDYHIINKKDLEELFAGTHMAETAWFIYNSEYPYFPIFSLYKFATWPVLEYLLKLGYTRLVREIISGRNMGDKVLNLYKKKANAVLGVPHSILQKYEHNNLRECDIKAIKQLIEYGRLGQLTLERFKFISSILTSDSNDPLDIFRNFGIEKVINYIDKIVTAAEKLNEEAHCGYGYRIIDRNSAWRDFQDYRKECHELGYDLTDEGIMFPRDFYAAHQRASETVQMQREEKLLRDNEEKNAKLAKKFHEAIKRYEKKVLNNENFLFRVCRSPDELQVEGSRLKHCVYNNYLNRITNGTSLIFFIREQNNPDKPLYTLEVNPKTAKIVQLRGFGNANAPEEIYKFAEKCLKEIKVNKAAA